MHNQKIAEIFYEMADILDIKNVQWKPRAYRRAARAVETLSVDVEELNKKGGIKSLEEIPGVGERLAKKIIEFLRTGKIKEHERLKKTVPKNIQAIMHLPGIGPKKAQKLSKLLKISTVAQLEKAAKERRIRSIHNFGEKSEKDILDAIYLAKESKGRIPLTDAKKQANAIISQLKKISPIIEIEAAGSIRRKKPTIRDIDIIASSRNPAKVIDAFTKLKGIKKVLVKGGKKATIILKSGTQADLRVFEPEVFGAGLFYFTGNKTYNIEIRKIAIKKGYKLSEYGLFDKKTNKLIAGRTEKEICAKLGIKYLKPEQREW